MHKEFLEGAWEAIGEGITVRSYSLHSFTNAFPDSFADPSPIWVNIWKPNMKEFQANSNEHLSFAHSVSKFRPQSFADPSFIWVNICRSILEEFLKGIWGGICKRSIFAHAFPHSSPDSFPQLGKRMEIHPEGIFGRILGRNRRSNCFAQSFPRSCPDSFADHSFILDDI